jgi:hypothetical protein
MLETYSQNAFLTPDCHKVFEKPLAIRRPESSDTDERDGNIRRDVAATLKHKRSTTSCLERL